MLSQLSLISTAEATETLSLIGTFGEKTTGKKKKLKKKIPAVVKCLNTHAGSPSSEVWTRALPRALGVPDPAHPEGGERLRYEERGCPGWARAAEAMG